MIRVAFTFIGGSNWKGGHNYLLNLFRILNVYQKDRITCVLFLGKDCRETDINPFRSISGVEIVSTHLLNKNRRVYSRMQSVLLGRDISLARVFDFYRIDIVFEVAQFFGWRLGVPVVAWIPDFQHLALPEMFGFLARWRREIGFRIQISGKRTIMLSSEEARRICEANYPDAKGNNCVIHFAIAPENNFTKTEARKIADTYGLPQIFFYMPNQFWQHKNHLLVVKALAILKQRGVPITVAASGNQKDLRDPEYFACLEGSVKKLNLGKEIRFLGMIPNSHVGALMMASAALLNPSLSEGWSTPVEEAKTLGVPMILSDLTVHKEQMGAKAIYFNRHSAESLADALHHFQPLDELKRSQCTDEAKQEAVQNVIRFGEKFAYLIESCTKHRTKQ